MYVVSEDNEDIKTELTRLETDKLDIAEYQAWTYVFGATSTGNDDYAITLPYWPEAYVLWQTFRFQADVTNTWEATLNVNALWAITIKKQHNETLEGWDIEAWQIVTVSFDWTNFQMDSQVATIPTIDIHWQVEKTDWDFEDELIEFDSISQWNKKIQVRNIPIWKLTEEDFLAGEDIESWESIFEERYVWVESVSAVCNVWDVVANTRRATRQIWSWVASSKIKMIVIRQWTTTEDFNIRIEWDSAWNPSGSLIDNNWVWSVAYNRAGFNVSDAHWYAVATAYSNDASRGFKIHPKKNIVMNTVTKVSAVTATRAVLKDEYWNILATATFVWDLATFTTFPILISWRFYRIELDKNGSSYDQRYTNLTTFTPVIWTNFDYVSWSVSGGDTKDPRNLVSITTTAEQEIDLAWVITIDRWTIAHIVMYQWTYESEEVDWSNYYQVAYIDRDTKTRFSKTFDWTNWKVGKPRQWYNVSTTVYKEQFSVTWEEATPCWLYFSSDWLNMYVVGQTGDDVNQYTLSTARMVSSAIYLQNFSVSAKDTQPVEVRFSSNGLKMYVLWLANAKVFEYTLSTARDISTASYTSEFAVWTEEATPVGMTFSVDWTKMYIVWTTSDTVFQYTLSTARDLSTASYATISFSVSTQETAPTWVEFSRDWLKMFIIGTSWDDVNQYTLWTAWDCSTAVYLRNFTIASFWATPYSVCFNRNTEDIDWTYMYVMVLDVDTVRQYTLSQEYPEYIYVDSYLFEDDLYALTNARYIYKLPDIPKLATANFASWEKVKYEYEWMTKKLSWLSLVKYYIWNTYWDLSVLPWTYEYIVWEWKDTDKLLLWNSVWTPISLTSSKVYKALQNWYVLATCAYATSSSTTLTAYADFVDWTTFLTSHTSWLISWTYIHLMFPVMKWQYYQVQKWTNWTMTSILFYPMS